jgi:hypothetical protein
VSAAQASISFTAMLKAATWSLMQVEYSATVAPQFEGSGLQPGLVLRAVTGSAKHPVSFSVQFARSCSWVGALLEVAKDRPFHLQAVAVGMAVLKYAYVSSQSLVTSVVDKVLSVAVATNVVTGSPPPPVPPLPPVGPVPPVPPSPPESSLQPAAAIGVASIIAQKIRLSP